MNDMQFQHQSIAIDGITVHAVSAGAPGNPAILFVHGWPTCWREFEQVMQLLCGDYHVVAIDLPGIGGSKGAPRSHSKLVLAEYVLGVMDAMALTDVTLVGCDMGGHVVYAFLKTYPERISRAVIMNSAVPGVKPWTAENRNFSWHFAFHSTPELPELLVTGREAEYFAHFYNRQGLLLEGYDTLKEAYAEAYRQPGALKAGFDLYRTMPEDEAYCAQVKDRSIHLPVLYLRGGNEFVKAGSILDRFGNNDALMAAFVEGFRENGLTNLTTAVIAGCGHYSAEERPREVAHILADFIAAHA